MKFSDVVEQARALLQRTGKLTYRVLKREFALDDEALEDLREQFIVAEEVAVDKDGKMLVWVGTDSEGEKGKREKGETDKEITEDTEKQDPSRWTPVHLAERIRAEQVALEARGAHARGGCGRRPGRRRPGGRPPRACPRSGA